MNAIEEMRKVIEPGINYISLLKAQMTKYKSKKMVGGKWVYVYDKPGKARDKKAEPEKKGKKGISKREILDAYENMSFKGNLKKEDYEEAARDIKEGGGSIGKKEFIQLLHDTLNS